jgi:hypothetical protein
MKMETAGKSAITARVREHKGGYQASWSVDSYVAQFVLGDRTEVSQVGIFEFDSFDEYDGEYHAVDSTVYEDPNMAKIAVVLAVRAHTVLISERLRLLRDGPFSLRQEKK